MITDEMCAKEVVDTAIEVHRTLGGPGLLEKTYFLPPFMPFRLPLK